MAPSPSPIDSAATPASGPSHFAPLANANRTCTRSFQGVRGHAHSRPRQGCAVQRGEVRVSSRECAGRGRVAPARADAKASTDRDSCTFRRETRCFRPATFGAGAHSGRSAAAPGPVGADSRRLVDNRAMPLRVHVASRADRFLGPLADVLSMPLEDPLVTEVVGIPTRGMERWLAQQLALRLGTRPEAPMGSAPT